MFIGRESFDPMIERIMKLKQFNGFNPAYVDPPRTETNTVCVYVVFFCPIAYVCTINREK